MRPLQDNWSHMLRRACRAALSALKHRAGPRTSLCRVGPRSVRRLDHDNPADPMEKRMKSDQTAADSRGTIQTHGAKRSAAIRRKGNGPTESMLADASDARDQSIREAAYAFYEARGRVDGFALEDWLKAETQFSTTH